MTFSPQSALTGPKRRELLLQERPVRGSISREQLGLEYFRNGYISFTCSIVGDLRGLKLDMFFISVFPSPDCHDRSACLFSYGIDSLEACRATQGRLEFRFKRASCAKQPAYLAFQTLEAQHIREAVWYLKYGVYHEVSVRERALQASSDAMKGTLTSDHQLEPAKARRQRVLSCFRDAESLYRRIDLRCRMIGCQRRCESSSNSNTATDGSTSNMMANSGNVNHDLESSCTSSVLRVGLGCLCDEHAAMLCGRRSPPKRGPMFSRERSSKMLRTMVSLVQSSHFSRMIRYQGPLLKKTEGGGAKYQVKKMWGRKIVVLVETPVGGLLCYYDKLAHCPGMTDTPKERRVIDLSSVLCIRPESPSGGDSSTPNYAFDIVTLYRNWTFAASDPEEYEIWLHVLTELVEQHSATAPDKHIRFPVTMVTVETPEVNNLSTLNPPYSGEVVLEVSAHGVCITRDGGDNDAEILHSWYFTDIRKWSVVIHQRGTCCLLSCLSTKQQLNATGNTEQQPSSLPGGNVGQYDEFLFLTPEASTICQVIEFYVGKCMAKLEVLSIEFMERCIKESNSPIRHEPSDKAKVGLTKTEQNGSSTVFGGGKAISAVLTKLHPGVLKIPPQPTHEQAIRSVVLAPLPSNGSCSDQDLYGSQTAIQTISEQASSSEEPVREPPSWPLDATMISTSQLGTSSHNQAQPENCTTDDETVVHDTEPVALVSIDCQACPIEDTPLSKTTADEDEDTSPCMPLQDSEEHSLDPDDGGDSCGNPAVTASLDLGVVEPERSICQPDRRNATPPTDLSPTDQGAESDNHAPQELIPLELRTPSLPSNDVATVPEDKTIPSTTSAAVDAAATDATALPSEPAYQTELEIKAQRTSDCDQILEEPPLGHAATAVLELNVLPPAPTVLGESDSCQASVSQLDWPTALSPERSPLHLAFDLADDPFSGLLLRPTATTDTAGNAAERVASDDDDDLDRFRSFDYCVLHIDREIAAKLPDPVTDQVEYSVSPMVEVETRTML